MNTMTLLGIDIGKHSFQPHGQDTQGHQVLRKKMSRGQLLRSLAQLPICTVVMESCGGAHWLAREIGALGHEVKLIAPQYVKPFVKGNKNDFIDAEAICEAASRPTMRFCLIKTAEQQTLSALHRVRGSLIEHRTAANNQIHGFLLEFGISLPIGVTALHRVPALLDDPQHPIPLRLRGLVMRLYYQIQQLTDEIKDIESDLKQQLKEDDAGQRLQSIPGIGPITASAVLADVGDVSRYRSGRDFAASLGPVPWQTNWRESCGRYWPKAASTTHIRTLERTALPPAFATSLTDDRKRQTARLRTWQ